MRSNIPSSAQIVRVLRSLTRRQLTALSQWSGVPFPTLMGIREQNVANPRIETVRAFWPHISKARAA